nr:shikimate kinase [Bradyrhizobium diazoefficiens]
MRQRERDTLRSRGEFRRYGQEAGHSQIEPMPPHRQSAPDLDQRPGKRRLDDAATQSIQSAMSGRSERASNALNAALRDIDRARDIREFSAPLVKHAKQLRMPAQATFLQKAAADFQGRFVPRLEENIRSGKSWNYATVCNEVSREAGGQEGVKACKALAARVSQLDNALMRDAEGRALSLLASSFGRHPRAAECRHGTIRIAEFCCDESRLLQELNSQSLSLLVNGFSKWPEEVACRQATLSVAGEVVRRPGQLSYTPLGLANLVNGFSKWPDQVATRQATVTIAGEVCRRAPRLSDFPAQQLANLVNGFSKWPERPECRNATLAIAAEICCRAARHHDVRLSNFAHQELANLLNGFSKWPEQAECRHAATAIALEVRCRADRGDIRLSQFAQQELASLVNGFSKWLEQPEAHQATIAIAREAFGRSNGVDSFTPQELATSANGFCKWPENAYTHQAIVAIAGEVRRRADRLSGFDSQALANLANGFSKYPEEVDARQATVAIAGEILGRADRLFHFTHQHLANLANGFSKCPEDTGCGDAIVVIAREVVSRANQLYRFTHQDLSTLVNGFSKWPEATDTRQAILVIAAEVVGRPLFELAELDLRHLVNGFSKWPEETETGRAVAAIAGEVRRRSGRLGDFTSRGLANLVNGFSKWPEGADCREATLAIASEVLRRQLSDFAPQDLANLVNGFCKWPDAAQTGKAIVGIAGELLRRADRLSAFTSQGLANLLNGFSKWGDEAACRQVVVDIARGLGKGGRRFGSFTTPELRMVANALGRGVVDGASSDDDAMTALLKDRLHQLAHYLHYAPDRLEHTGVQGITLIFKALAKARLFEDVGLLAPVGLGRLAELVRAPDFDTENLETIGNLSIALLPLARGSQKELRPHRRPALYLLNDIQPVVERKIEAHLKASEPERTRAPFASRRPALSIYQVLKARALLETLFQRPYVEGKKPDLKVRQQELQRGTKEILASTRDLIQADLSNMSWNLIAQIEVDNPVDALDSFMAQDAATIQAQHPASVFDVYQVLRDMDHEPRSPQGNAGLMQLPVVDLQGRPVATDPEIRYSTFHRLTSGAIEVVAVQLPGKPSAFMLARTLTYKGVPYRMDLFGGSKLKPPKPTLSQVAARLPSERPAGSSGGKLLAIPYAETAPGTSFEKLLRAWAPFKEAYWYTQRRGFAAPPSVKGLGPHDYALEGTFKLLLAPDRATNEAHPFKLIGAKGPIALRPHDGCGFIKASLAERMPAVRRAGPQEGPDRMPAFGEARRSSVPASALQHYSRSEQVAEEAGDKVWNWLESRKVLTSDDLFRAVTAGHLDGLGAVAVPSDDGCLHVPTLKSDTLTGTSGVLIGRAPYDKPNLRPFIPQRVKSAVDGDPTAAFLDRCVAVQYSFSVAQKLREELAADDPSFFAKGILIVVPDAMWPADYADRGLVLSAEDVKCHSSWTERKDRAKNDTPVDCVGILQVTEVFAPGSLVAVPIGEQKKLDGDFDGDTVVIIGDRPQLYEHVRQFDETEQARGVHSLKPPKSYTPAIEGNNYQFSRASQILAATLEVLEIYSALQRNFLAQSHEARRWFAERAIFGTYEGVHHELRREIGHLLNQEQVHGPDIQETLERAKRELEIAEHPVAREAAELLVADLDAWAAKTDEHVLSDPSESLAKVSPTVSPALCELFPELAEAYPATAQPRDRIQVLLDHYPARIDPRPDGYIADDLVQSASNLLSLGIKVGTDGYKSDTGVRLFMKKSQELGRLLHQTPGLKFVPFSKSMAATLSQGRFDVDATLENLKENPTLAASVMDASIRVAAQKKIIPKPSSRRVVAEDTGMAVTLTPEDALARARIEAARAKAEEETITAAAISVAETLRQAGIHVNMSHLDRRVRSEGSMTDQLTGMSVTSAGSAQLISNAVRHVFEVSDGDFARAFKKAMLSFDEQGYAEIRTTNWFRMRNPTFVGIKAVLATPKDYRFEVEFHTPASYNVKIANHDTYKLDAQLRHQQSGDALERLKENLAQRARERCKEVVVPDGAKDIPHWEIEADHSGGAGAAFALQAAESGSHEDEEIVAGLGQRPIVLVGMPGAGKSSIGRRLAKRLRMKFVDSDDAIRAQAGMSISKLCQIHGEQHFKDLEARVIAGALKQGPAVIATGSDAFVHDGTRSLVHENAVSIWLKADAGVIVRRNKGRSSRRLSQAAESEAMVMRLVSEREPVYQTADLTVNSGDGSQKYQVDECVAVLHGHLRRERESARNIAA